MPSPIDAATIAGLQELVQELAMPDTYELRRATGATRDSRGNPKQADATVESGACALRGSRLTPQERAYAAQLGTKVAYAVDLPIDTTATAKDRLRVNATRTFEVVGVLREGALSLSATAFCEEAG